MAKSPITALAVFCVLLVAGCGDGDGGGGNADRFEGEDQKVAAVIDRLGQAARDGDVKTICEDLITVELQRSVRAQSRSSCGDEFRQNIVSDKTKYRVRSVEVDGENATAAISDQEDRESTVALVKADDDWRIARIR